MPSVSTEQAERAMLLESTKSTERTFTCTGCGALFASNVARVQRAAAGSKGDPETPHLCWVCAHLHISVVREIARDNAGISAAVEASLRNL